MTKSNAVITTSNSLTPAQQVEQARRLRKGLQDFRPPRDNAFLISIAGMLGPGKLKKQFSVVDIQVLEDGLDRLRELDGKRRILCPNHPSKESTDPQVMFALGRKVKQRYNFIAAREAFDEDNGMNGFWMQQLGCYSVVRGAADRPSYKMTRKLLQDNERGLVIFPEGEVNRQNGAPLPCEPGIAQMGFSAIDKASSLLLVPIGIYYGHIEDITPGLEDAISRSAAKLGISPTGSMYERVRAVGEALFARLVGHYNLKLDPALSMNQKIDALRNHILATAAQSLRVEIPETLSTLDALRFVRNALDEIVYLDEEDMSDYAIQLHRERAESLLPLYRDIRRVQINISMYDGYLSAEMTQDRCAEVLDKFETELFGKSTIKGKRNAYIHVGEPIDLHDSYPAYTLDKKGTVTKVADNLHNRLESSIKRAGTAHTPRRI